MDILTEIFRIKQVMGLITEQASGNLVTDDVYEAIKNIESVFSKTDKNGEIIGIAYNPRGKESNIKKAIQETIGLDDWGKMDSNLKGQIYSFMFQSDSGPMTRLRWLAGLAQAIDPKINRTNIVDKPITDSNVQSAIKLIKDNINSINYNKYMTVVKDQYKNIYGTINDDANKLKIWGPRPEALDKLMNGDSWESVKKWWFNEIGDSNQTTQTTNTPSRDLTSTNNSQSTAITPAAAAATSSPTATASTNIGTLVATTLAEGQPGDPYVYIKNEDGDFLTYKCGKTNERCPDLSTNLYSVPWINVTKKLVENPNSDKYKNAEEAIRTIVYKEDTPTPAEETEPEETTPTPTKQDILNKFRDYYYSTYLFYINSKYSGKITKKPVKPAYKGQIDSYDNLYDINLVGDFSSTPSGLTVDTQLFINVMKNFITKKVNVGNVQYELKAYNSDAILPASSIFKRDSTGYVGDIKAENEIKSEKLGIYKVE